ncbi:hypothetical protein DFH06DRAFT_1371916 [Mycena polygramma]|nr:hypothetical protein DFH06DRAFT_1371916 [Mycena polygramma]
MISTCNARLRASMRAVEAPVGALASGFKGDGKEKGAREKRKRRWEPSMYCRQKKRERGDEEEKGWEVERRSIKKAEKKGDGRTPVYRSVARHNIVPVSASTATAKKAVAASWSQRIAPPSSIAAPPSHIDLKEQGTYQFKARTKKKDRAFRKASSGLVWDAGGGRKRRATRKRRRIHRDRRKSVGDTRCEERGFQPARRVKVGGRKEKGTSNALPLQDNNSKHASKIPKSRTLLENSETRGRAEFWGLLHFRIFEGTVVFSWYAAVLAKSRQMSADPAAKWRMMADTGGPGQTGFSLGSLKLNIISGIQSFFSVAMFRLLFASFFSVLPFSACG